MLCRNMGAGGPNSEGPQYRRAFSYKDHKEGVYAASKGRNKFREKEKKKMFVTSETSELYLR